MYTQYFGLTEKPFAIAPNPRYLYMSELHREALAHLIYGLNSDGCIILLTGEVGTGKTTVCRCLLEQLPEATDIAIILNPKLTVSDLLKTICEELAIEQMPDSPSNKNYIDLINRHLLQTHAKGRSTALVIDEAQNLDADVLEQLRLLTNLETDTQKLLKIILLGQPELRLMLAKPEMAQVNQRITSKYHLKPLQPDDVRVYIQHRLKVAGGGTGRLFSTQAIDHVIKLSKGIPRLINLLCDRALLGAYAEGADHVSLKIMKKAGREIMEKPKTPPSPARRRRLLLTLLIISVLGLTATYYLLDEKVQLFSANKETKQPLPSQDAPLPKKKSEDKAPAAGQTDSTVLQPEKSKKKFSPPVILEEALTDQEKKKSEAEGR
jgi:general secretion pathway protein A